MDTLLPDTHLPDGELVRLLDGELDAVEANHANVHLAGCLDCRSRLETLRHRSLRLGAVLRAADWPLRGAAPPAPAAPADELAARRHGAGKRAASGTPWLRAAAFAALLLGGAVLASPARAWITDWIAARWAEATSTPDDEPLAQPMPAPGADDAAGTRVQFVPAAVVFQLEFTARQPGGAVTIRTGEPPHAVAEMVRGGASTELLVLPDGLRVRNGAEGAAEYRVAVPPIVERVRVRIAGEPAGEFGAAELARGVRVGLGDGLGLRK